MSSPAAARFRAVSSRVIPTKSVPPATESSTAPELSSCRPSRLTAKLIRVSSVSPSTARSRVISPVKEEPDTLGSQKAMRPCHAGENRSRQPVICPGTTSLVL